MDQFNKKKIEESQTFILIAGAHFNRGIKTLKIALTQMNFHEFSNPANDLRAIEQILTKYLDGLYNKSEQVRGIRGDFDWAE